MCVFVDSIVQVENYCVIQEWCHVWLNFFDAAHFIGTPQMKYECILSIHKNKMFSKLMPLTSVMERRNS